MATKQKLSGAGALFLRTAAAGNKTPMNAEGMANALIALGWEVDEQIVPTRIEGEGAWEARQLFKDKVTEAVKDLHFGGGNIRRGYHGGSAGLSTYYVYGTEAQLKKVKAHLKTFQTDEVGATSFSFGRGGVHEETEQVRTDTGHWVQQKTGKWKLTVSVVVNLRVWEVANKKLKGTKKKVVTLKQVLKTLKPEKVTEIKAGRFWTSLYSRQLKFEAIAFVESYKGALPEYEETLTPEEEVRRLYDSKVKAALTKFTEPQLEAVEDYFIAEYRGNLKAFLAYQDKIFPEYKAAWEAEGSPKSYATTKFPPRGSSSYQRKPVTEEQQKGNCFNGLLMYAMRYVENVDGYPSGIRVYKAREDADELCVKAGKNTAARIRAAFIAKNTMKMSAILVGKGNLDDIKVNAWSKHSFEGELGVTFTDGTSFIVRNKTVYKISNKGTNFAQFPTTFHKVIQVDGTKMKGTASEKRMVEEFSVAS